MLLCLEIDEIHISALWKQFYQDCMQSLVLRDACVLLFSVESYVWVFLLSTKIKLTEFSDAWNQTIILLPEKILQSDP